MELYRISDKLLEDCSQRSENPKMTEQVGLKAAYHFHRFGNGTHRLNDFRVYVAWADVKSIIQAYSKAGHEEAQALEHCFIVDDIKGG